MVIFLQTIGGVLIGFALGELWEHYSYNRRRKKWNVTWGKKNL